MPFGGYENFEACVADNKDKENPDGFCSWLEKQTTGKNTEELVFDLPPDVAYKYWSAFVDKSDDQWVGKSHGWTRKAEHAAMKTREVYGIPIFSVGTHNGDKYTLKDLKGMLSAFEELQGRIDPPVKIGHTSDEFNKKLAKKMGIEPEFITGENGSGMIAFGWIDSLRILGEWLYADLTNVPEPIAELIESKAFNKVSAEIMFNLKDKGKTYPKVLTGLALLGAELPAVKESGLETAAIFQYASKPDAVIELAIDLEDGEITYEAIEPALDDVTQAIEKVMKGKAGVAILRTMWKEVRSKVKGLMMKKNAEDYHTLEERLRYLRGDLGLPDDASVDDIIAAIEKLKETGGTEGMKEKLVAVLEIDGKSSEEQIIQAVTENFKMSKRLKAVAIAMGLGDDAGEDEIRAALKKLKDNAATVDADDDETVKKFASLETSIKNLTDNLAAEKRTNRLAFYTGVLTPLKTISGKPEEVAEAMVKLEEQSPEEAQKLLASYQATNKQLIAAGIFTSSGRAGSGENADDTHEFIKETRKYALDKGVDDEAAMLAVKASSPGLWRQYRKDNAVVAPVDNNDGDAAGEGE